MSSNDKVWAEGFFWGICIGVSIATLAATIIAVGV